jgi:hypothetical protein
MFGWFKRRKQEAQRLSVQPCGTWSLTQRGSDGALLLTWKCGPRTTWLPEGENEVSCHGRTHRFTGDRRTLPITTVWPRSNASAALSCQTFCLVGMAMCSSSAMGATHGQHTTKPRR